MIERDAQYIQLCCDREDCKSTTKVFHKDDFIEMIELARADGWVVYKKFGKWKHYCKWVHSE